MSDRAARDGPPRALRWAAGVLVIEAVALVALGIVVLVKVVTGSPSSVGFAVTAALMTIGTGLVLVALARAVLRCRPWAFVPVLVLQGLALPVGYSLAIESGLWRYGGPVLLLALTELALLISPSSRRVLGPQSRG